MELNYREMGEGQPMLILHGLLGSADNWQTLGKKLAEDFHVFLVDLRGHGRSPHDEDLSYEALAGDIHELFRSRGLSSGILIGHSMGGKVAMRFAQTWPDLLDKLVVADMAPKAYPVHHEGILDAMESIDLDAMKSRGQADKALAEQIPAWGERQFLLKNLYWKEKGRLGWKADLQAIRKNMNEIVKPLTDQKVTVPTLFMRGENSDYIRDADKSAIREQFNQVRFATIRGSGHWIHAEAPEQFLATLLGFLE